MRTFYCVLIAAAALAAWYPYDLNVAGTGGLLDGLLGTPAPAAIGLAAALPFLLMGFVGQTILPPARRPLLRVPGGLILGLLVAVAIDVGASLFGHAVSGALYWQVPALLLGIVICLLPPVRVRMELGWVDGAPVAVALLVLWLLYRFYPYVPSFDPASVDQNLKQLIPFFGFTLSDYVRESAVWLIVAMMLARIGPERFSSFILLLFGAVVLTIEVHIAGNPVTVSDAAALFTAFLLHGFLLGWLPGRGAIYGLLLLLALAFLAVWPLTMRVEPVGLAWRPFAMLLEGAGDETVPRALLAVFMFVSAVWAFREAGFGSTAATVLTLLALIGVEALRLFTDGRPPDPAGPMVALLAGIGLAGLRRRPRRRWRPAEANAPAVAAAVAGAPIVYEAAASGHDVDAMPDAVGHPDEFDNDDEYRDDDGWREETPAWSLEAGGGAELRHDDGGIATGVTSASGYVPEEVVEEEELDDDTPIDGEESWREEEPYVEEDAEALQHDDGQADDELSPPLNDETRPDWDTMEEVDEPLAASYSIADIVWALARFVAGIAVVGGLFVGLRQVPLIAGALPPLLGEASAIGLVMIGAVMLVGAIAATAIGRFAATTRFPLLTLPLLAGLAGIVFVFVFDMTVGGAGLATVFGSPTVYNAVLTNDFAGPLGQAMVGFIRNKSVFDAVELLIRGASGFVLMALPLAAFVAIFLRMSDYPGITGFRRFFLGLIVWAVFIGCVLPWLIVGKVVLFDTPARSGLVSMVDADAGAYLLLVLLLLFGWNAALLARRSEASLWRVAIGRIVATAVALPVGFVIAAFAFNKANDHQGLPSLIATPTAPEWQTAATWAAIQLLWVGILAYGSRVLPAHRPARLAEAGETDRDDG